jgi:adenylylsulfate kinase
MICIKCSNEITPEKRITIQGRENECYDCYKTRTKTICIDLDGVIAQYDGWNGPDHVGEPMPGAGDFLQRLSQDYEIVIHTTRQYPGVWDWLLKYRFQDYITGITSTKVPAVAYIDDRAICHQGDFEQTLIILENFKPHWKK